MSTPVPLSKLVDLAIGTPVIGVVNFNALHSLLHAMLKQLNIQDVQADIDDVDRDFLGTSTQLKDVISPSDSDSKTDSKSDSKTDSKSDSKVDESDSLSSISKKGRAPYHCLEMKVEKLAQQLEELNALPSNQELFEKAKLERTRYMADMWQYMQLKKRVDANEEGVGKLMSMIQDLMQDMMSLKDANNELQNKVDNFNTDDLNKRVTDLENCMLDMDGMKKRLSDLEKYLSDVTDQLNALPRGDEFALQFVTWPGLEEALKGVRDEMGNLPTITKIYQEHSFQTDDVASRPSTARPSSVRSERAPSPVVASPRPPSPSVSRASESSAYSGPSPRLLEILEKLGTLTTDHAALRLRVEKLEEEMKNKLDKGALDNLMDQITTLYTVNDQPMVIHVPEIHKVEVSTTYTQTAPEPEPKPKPEPVDTKPEPVPEKVEPVVSPIQRVEIIERVIEKHITDPSDGASSDILEQLHNLMKDIENLQNMHAKDGDALRRIQEMVLQLQADNEKLQDTTRGLIEDNEQKSKHLQNLQQLSDKLSDQKADKEYVAMEVDVKADRTQLDGKVNQGLFDSTTSDLNKMLQEILDKLSGSDDQWKDALKALENDLEGKMDRLELDSLKNWLERRLKALNKKIEQSAGGWTDDDAAGLRKQLLMRFNCLSCDRPVDMMPTGPVASLPAQTPMPPTKSPRPYTSFELEQIRQHPRFGHTPRGGSYFSPRYQTGESTDYYATERQCGGGHTLTFPHKRTTRMSHLKEEADAGTPEKSEVVVQGVDGHIYKGRMERASLEAKLRGNAMTPQSKSAATLQQQSSRLTRPMSARSYPLSPHPVQSPRPQSALPGSSRESIESTRSPRVRPDDADVIDVDVPMTETVAD